jgi:hypothetical protein
MKIVHVVPRPCIFEPVIQQRADALGHECIHYQLNGSAGEMIRGIFDLYRSCRKRPGHLFIFHMVPHFRLLLLALLLRNFHYCLLYWGEDYYSTFLSAAEFEQHCISKSPLLQQANYGKRYRNSIRKVCRKFLRVRIGLLVLRQAAAIVSLSPKQFRILRLFYFKAFRRPLRTPQLWIRGYGHETGRLEAEYSSKKSDDTMRILVCHSATPTVAHRQSMDIVKIYRERWNVNITICGFLSYSGGDEADRDRLEVALKAAAEFAESVQFERVFLAPDRLKDLLKQVDVAVFSCLRDEGVSLLTQFARMGGMISFNRFSMNYDFFKNFCPDKLLAHEEFLESSPEVLRRRRMQSMGALPKMLEYHQLDQLSLHNGKLDLSRLV